MLTFTVFFSLAVGFVVELDRFAFKDVMRFEFEKKASSFTDGKRMKGIREEE